MTWAQGHLLQCDNAEIGFHSQAVRVTVFDGRGRTLWHKTRVSAEEPMRWDGLTVHGDRAPVGSYTCRIQYADARVIYVPFVLIR
jgi:hypothetical protein